MGLMGRKCLYPVAAWVFVTDLSWGESLGNLAQYPPKGVDLTVTTADDGMPRLEPLTIPLASGRYYRLNIHCPDVR